MYIKLKSQEKQLLHSLELREGNIDRFILYPPVGDTIIQKNNNRAVIISNGDHLEFSPIRESAYDYIFKKIMK